MGFTIISLIISVFLTGCSTNNVLDKTEKDGIYSLAMDKDNMYAMGIKDYQFTRESTSSFEAFLKSQYAKKITYIKAKAEVDNNRVSASLDIIISPNYLTQKQQQDLIENYNFKLIKDIDKASSYWENATLLTELQIKPDLLIRHYWFNGGQIVEIKNRQFNVDNYVLSEPILINVDYYKYVRNDLADMFIDIAMVPVNIIFIPVLFGVMYWEFNMK